MMQAEKSPKTKAPTSTMRRSCHFCRSRKIRCSGQNICNACRERNLDCVYGKEGAKGRPKRSLSKTSNPTSTPVLTGNDSMVLDGISDRSLSPAFSLDSNLSIRTPSLDRESSSDFGSADPSIGAELDRRFRANFLDGAPATNAYGDALASFSRKLHEERHTSGSTDQQRPRNMSYDGMLDLINHELVAMLSLRFGNLGCHSPQETCSQYFVRSMVSDGTQTMFDEVALSTDPFADFDSHRTLQMLEVWFSVHPLSIIISKTLFLRSYRANTHDRLLLAAILADACSVQEGFENVAQAKSEALFRFAAKGLHERTLNGVGCLATIQTMMLLGWRDLCLARARRAACLLGLSCKLADRLQASAEPEFSRINGTDVGEVETELIRNIQWLCFSVTVWAFMQMDYPFSDLLPQSVPGEFPPVEPSASAVIQLDKVSANVSTVQSTAALARKLWPLSHIASTIAHIYALYPRHQGACAVPPKMSWHARLSHQLRNLSSLNQDITFLCSSIRRILTESAELLDRATPKHSSQAVVITAYHTIIVHLLFPKSETESGPRLQTTITNDVLENFCTSAKAMLHSFAIVQEGSEEKGLLPGSKSYAGAEISLLALDACARALEVFYSQCRIGLLGLPDGRNVWERRSELSFIASEMHKAIKNNVSLPSAKISGVKKHLKQMKTCFEQMELCDTSMPLLTRGASDDSAVSVGTDSPAEASTPSDTGMFALSFGSYHHSSTSIPRSASSSELGMPLDKVMSVAPGPLPPFSDSPSVGVAGEGYFAAGDMPVDTLGYEHMTDGVWDGFGFGNISFDVDVASRDVFN